MKSVNWHYPLFLVPALVLTACSDNDTTQATNDPSMVTRDVTIDFAAKINGADFACGQTYTGVGTGSHDYQVNDFRLFVHEAHIHDDASGQTYHIELTQDGVWQQDELALLDFETGCGTGTAETNTSLRGEVTLLDNVDMTNTEVCFTVGVPTSMNHQDTTNAASPLNDASMQWNWLAGYKYIRIDGVGDFGTDPANANTGYNIHLGAQGCSNDGAGTGAPPTQACSVPNTFEVCVDGFNVGSSRVAVDAGPVLAGSDVSTNTTGTAFGCMSFMGDEDCVEVMPRLGLDYSYGNATGTSTYTAGQAMFTRE
jgi:uncharacterized repeat protein (TIGR04052 family)